MADKKGFDGRFDLHYEEEDSIIYFNFTILKVNTKQLYLLYVVWSVDFLHTTSLGNIATKKIEDSSVEKERT